MYCPCKVSDVNLLEIKTLLFIFCEGFFAGKDPLKLPKTGVSENVLLELGQKFSTPPPDFNVHKGKYM